MNKVIFELSNYSIASVAPVRVTLAVIGMIAAWLFSPEIAQAAVAFGEIGQNVATNAKGVAKGITMAGYAGGLGMGVVAGIDLYKASRPQAQISYGVGITKLLIGAGLLGLGETLGSGSATLFGSDQTSGLNELGIK